MVDGAQTKSIVSIKANAPEGANGYEISKGEVYYFIDDFFIWTGGKWSIVIFNDGYNPNIKPL